LNPTTTLITVQAKTGFSTKNRRPRIIPIPDALVEALKTYKVLYPNRPTIVVSSVGKPEGHFLAKLKDIVVQDVQEWIGHADLLTLRRYLANINVKSQRARTMANSLAESLEVDYL